MSHPHPRPHLPTLSTNHRTRIIRNCVHEPGEELLVAQGHPKSDKVRVRTSSSLAAIYLFLPQGRRSKLFTPAESWRLSLPPPPLPPPPQSVLHFTRLLKWKVLVVWGQTTLDSSLLCFLCFPGQVPSALCSQALRIVGEDHMRMQRKGLAEAC